MNEDYALFISVLAVLISVASVVISIMAMNK